MACTITTPLVSVCVAWCWWSVTGCIQLADRMHSSSLVMLAAVVGFEQALA